MRSQISRVSCNPSTAWGLSAEPCSACSAGTGGLSVQGVADGAVAGAVTGSVTTAVALTSQGLRRGSVVAAVSGAGVGNAPAERGAMGDCVAVCLPCAASLDDVCGTGTEVRAQPVSQAANINAPAGRKMRIGAEQSGFIESRFSIGEGQQKWSHRPGLSLWPGRHGVQPTRPPTGCGCARRG